MFISLSGFSQPVVDGYMKAKGNMDLAGSLTYESFSKYYASLNQKVDLSRTSIAISLYDAIGLYDWLDFQVNVPYIYTAAAFSNFQDLSAYFKASIFDVQGENQKNFRIMMTLGTSFPLTDYETEGLNAIGQQATAFDGRIVIQYEMSNNMFVMIQGGYTYREDPVPSSYPFAFKLGWAKPKYYFDIWYDQQYAIGGNDYADFTQDMNISFRTFGVSYGKAGVSFYKPFSKNTGFSATASYILWGRNVGQTLGVSVGLIRRFHL